MLRAVMKLNAAKLDRMISEAPKRADQGAGDAAEWVVNDIGSNWSPMSPSSYGNAPAVVTGALDSSIYVDNKGRDLLGMFASGKDVAIKSIKVDAEHGGILEFTEYRYRPFVQPAIDRASGVYPEMLGRVIKP